MMPKVFVARVWVKYEGSDHGFEGAGMERPALRVRREILPVSICQNSSILDGREQSLPSKSFSTTSFTVS